LYNLDVFEYELHETMALYGSIPLMLSHHATSSGSSRTSGLFWLNAAETWIDIEYESSGASSHWFSESGIVDFFVLTGPTPQKLSHQYAQLTGTTPLPPLFSLAYHQCRWNYKDEADVDDVNRKFDVHNMPMDVIWLDIEHTDGKKYFTWDGNKFPTPEKMLQGVAAMGRRMVTIVDPHIKRESGYYIHEGASSRDYYVKRADGTAYEGFCWPGPSMYLDFTSAEVRDWWSQQFAYTAYKGSSDSLFIWNDMNEPSVFNGPEVTMFKDLVHAGAWEHRDVHNLFGMYVHRATYEGLMRRNVEPTRPFVLSRAFFAGSQRYGAIWTGDNAAQWEHLEASIPMLLSLSVTGITFSGADVGGFFGNPDTELLTRWYQAAAYQPFFRGHAHLDSKRREPYLFDADTTDRIRSALRSRYALLPYWYTQFYNSEQSGLPVMRPLWYDYPNDAETYSLQHQYLIGSDLLVSPALKPSTTTVRVYFPGSEPWYDVATLEAIKPGSYESVQAPITKVPVFQRGGSIIARKDRPRRSTTQMLSDPYSLTVALDSRAYATGDLYIDDYKSFAYQQSLAFLHRRLTFDNDVLESISTVPDHRFQIGNQIERITIVGLARIPTSATLRQDGAETTLALEQLSSNSIVIRRPLALVKKNWRITLAF
jgi:mannosyl-oligosaccharide alpha-1,3-glucosidase